MPFLGSFRDWYRYQTGVVPIPPMQRENGTNTNQSGTGTTHQNRIGTSTNPSSTSTTSCIPVFMYFYIVKPNPYTDSIGNLIND